MDKISISLEELKAIYPQIEKRNMISVCNKIYMLINQKDARIKIKQETCELIKDITLQTSVLDLNLIYNKILLDMNVTDQYVENCLEIFGTLAFITTLNKTCVPFNKRQQIDQ